MRIRFSNEPVKTKAPEPKPKRTVLIDTSEQTPWPFPDSERRNLKPGGDYSLDGLESWIRIERKSINDLVGSLRPRYTDEELAHIAKMRAEGKESTLRTPRERLKDEFRWMCQSGIRYPWWIIEGTIGQIRAWDYQGGMHPNAVIGHVIQWAMRFGIFVAHCQDHAEAFWFANRVLVGAEKLWEEVTDGDELDDEHRLRGPVEGAGRREDQGAR